MSEIKLKPCPFCGGKAVLTDDICSVVKCVECGAESGMFKISKEYSSDEKAAEAWNRRTDNDPNSSDSR
ncbi:MAG: Lar family restriction alleviation protein [Oscillospiraceae bacterium]